MPTFENPSRDATEASHALRALAYATRAFDDPADTYGVIGDLLSGVRSLRQVLDQLADAHLDHRARAFDDAGDPDAGAASALAAADELHQAGTLLDAVEGRLDTASQYSGHIAWHPAPETPAAHWISVVFLQGEEADEVLDLIDREGTDAAIDHLAGFDSGDETTQAALEDGHVYDAPAAGALDRTATRDGYTLTYSPFLGHVSLLRAYTPPEPDQSSVASPQRAAVQGQRGTAGGDWFTRHPDNPSSQGRGLAL